MVLYLTDEAHEEALDGLNEDIHVKILANQDMQLLFRQELQHLAAVTHIIVEESVMQKDTWEVAAASLRTTKEIPMLLIVSDAQMADTFVREKNYDVMNRYHRDIRELIQDWILKAIAETEEKSWNHTWIAVAGLTPSAGATSMATHLASYIHKQQLEVSITERADIFRILALHYGWEEIAADSYQWGGIIYNHNQIDESSPFVIFDLGVMTQQSIAIWKQCQIKVLVVDGKPYRLEKLSEQLRHLKEYPGEIILAFTFVPDTEKAELRKKFMSDKVRVWFAPLQPDLFIATEEYQELVQGYVIPLPVEKKEKKVIPFQLPRLSGKNKVIIGSIVLVSICIGFGLATIVRKQNENRFCEIAVEESVRMDFTSITRLRMMLVTEQAAMTTELLQETVTEDVTDATTEMITEAATTEQATGGTSSSQIQTTAQNTQAPATEAPTTEEQQASGVVAQLTPSLSGYHGQIYTGSQVIAIMNKFAGQPVAMHLITRSSDGWYNYAVNGSGLVAASAVSAGTAQVDTQCSFLCQVIQVNGEDVGLEFLQQ